LAASSFVRFLPRNILIDSLGVQGERIATFHRALRGNMRHRLDEARRVERPLCWVEGAVQTFGDADSPVDVPGHYGGAEVEQTMVESGGLDVSMRTLSGPPKLSKEVIRRSLNLPDAHLAPSKKFLYYVRQTPSMTAFWRFFDG
jgi:hypothetical protein